jgi:hypothetical protein
MRRPVLLLATIAALAVPTPAAAATAKIPSDDLRAIRVVLRSWVPDVIGRRNPLAAYGLATDALRSTTTRAQWKQGDLPVTPYPADPENFGLKPILVTPDDVIFDLMLQPRKGSNAGVAVYTTEVQLVNGRWLVASMYPTAQFAAPGDQRSITAAPDLGPHKQGVHQRTVLGNGWMLALIAVILVPLAAVPVALVVAWRRNRPPELDDETRTRAAMPWR